MDLPRVPNVRHPRQQLRNSTTNPSHGWSRGYPYSHRLQSIDIIQHILMNIQSINDLRVERLFHSRWTINRYFCCQQLNSNVEAYDPSGNRCVIFILDIMRFFSFLSNNLPQNDVT